MSLKKTTAFVLVKRIFIEIAQAKLSYCILLVSLVHHYTEQASVSLSHLYGFL